MNNSTSPGLITSTAHRPLAVELTDTRIDSVEVRTCTTCRRSLDVASFAKKRSGLSPKCRQCTSEYSKAHYRANKARRVELAAQRSAWVRAELQELVYAARAEASCALCGALHEERPLISSTGDKQCADLIRSENRAGLIEQLADPELFWICKPCFGASWLWGQTRSADSYGGTAVKGVDPCSCFESQVSLGCPTTAR